MVSNDAAMVKIDAYIGTTYINHFGCAENLGTDTFDLALIYLQESAGTGTISTTVGEYWFINASFKLRCIAVRAGDTQAQFVIHKESDYLFQGTVTYGFYSSSIIVNQININTASPLTVFAKAGLFKGLGSTFFWVGSTKKVNALIYGQEVAILDVYPGGTNCISPKTGTTTMPVYSKPYFQGAITPIPPLYYQRSEVLTSSVYSSIITL